MHDPRNRRIGRRTTTKRDLTKEYTVTLQTRFIPPPQLDRKLEKMRSFTSEGEGELVGGGQTLCSSTSISFKLLRLCTYLEITMWQSGGAFEVLQSWQCVVVVRCVLSVLNQGVTSSCRIVNQDGDDELDFVEDRFCFFGFDLLSSRRGSV